MPYAVLHSVSLSCLNHLSPSLFRSQFREGKRTNRTVQKFRDCCEERKGRVQMPSSKLVASSPLETGFPRSVDFLEPPQIYNAQDQVEKAMGDKGGGSDEILNTSMRSLSVNCESKAGSNLRLQPPSYSGERSKTDINCESSLFSSSFSEFFNRKRNGTLYHPPADVVGSCHKDDEPFQSVKRLEAQSIGNFLPDEDDLLSGITNELGCIAITSNKDDLEDFDLFSSGGGMELGGDECLSAGQRTCDSTWGNSSTKAISYGSAVTEQPSRTLIVKNINICTSDSELRVLFQQYGDIRALYTACKQQGFVMISYYDIRAARNAMRALQKKPLRGIELSIQYLIPKDNRSMKDINHGTLGLFNLDSAVSNDDLHQMFGIYGDIKEIYEAPHSYRGKYIEFYDVRAAQAALRALNRENIFGKQIMVEPGWSEVTRRLMKMGRFELEQGEPVISQSLDDSLTFNSTGMVSPGVIKSRCIDNEPIHSLHPAVQGPIDTIVENAIFGGSSSVPSTLHVPVGASAGSKNSLSQLSHSLEQDMFGVREMAGGANIAGSGRFIGRMGPSVQPVDVSGDVLGCFGNPSRLNSGHHQSMWRDNTYQQHPSSSIVWPNSPTMVNGINARCSPKLSGFPAFPPHLLNMVSPAHRHHVGSAPTIDPSIWDRQQAYTGKSPDASGFHLGSLETLGFPVGSPLLPLEIAPQSIFSHTGGNSMDISSIAELHASQQMGHIFPGTSPSISYHSPCERARGFLYRRNEVNTSYADKKQYELNIDRILHGEDKRTTLMIKNIPNKYTSKMLLAAIDELHRGIYDFIYLPIDFKNKCNVGYAFINLIDPLQIVPFYQTFNGKKWEKFNSEKVATLAYARIQGKAALVAHFQNSSLMNEDKRCRPILFHTDGPNAGDQEPFPMSSNIRSRSGKPRNFGYEGNHCPGCPSSTKFEDPSNKTDSSLDSTKDSD